MIDVENVLKRLGCKESTVDFGKMMKRSRLNSGTTLYEMSKFTGLSSAYISGLENQRSRITDTDLIKINEFFGYHGVIVDWKSLADEANSKPLNPVVFDPNEVYF